MSFRQSDRFGEFDLKKLLVPVCLILALLVITGVYHIYKPLPEGLSMEGEINRVPSSAVSFLTDYSFIDSKGERQTDQEIFDEIFSLIRGAEDFILLDMFLFNDFLGAEPRKLRELSEELTSLLVQKKKARPEMEIIFISDPINTIYGAQQSEDFLRLRKAGVEVVLTDLKKLRDSNIIYSPFWRVFFQWFGTGNGGFMPNPFEPDGEGISIRAYLKLLNFKANHRKVIVADSMFGGNKTLSTIVTSANPHDGSSAHENVALRVDGFIWRDILAGELAVINMSDYDIELPWGKIAELETLEQPRSVENPLEVQVLTEEKIRQKMLELLENSDKNDSVKIVMFYISDRKIINSLLEAEKRGVEIRLVLDPNKDAFGRKKTGIPTRPVARELREKSDGDIKIRWCDTRGEQCHSKMILVNRAGTYFLNLGSANLTRRNLGDYNLETNLLVSGSRQAKAIRDANEYFEKIWANENGRIYTADYQKYASDSFLKRSSYLIMEYTGFCSF